MKHVEHTTHVEHTVTVNAPAAIVWEVLADVEGYADIFPPTQKAEVIERGPGYEVARLHVDVAGETTSWTSRRDLDEERRVIAYRQLETAPIVGSMGGEWRALPLAEDRTQLVLTHDFVPREPVDGLVAGRLTPDEARRTLEAAVERNSVADLNAVRDQAELRHGERGGVR
ncbi:aromatase/cyclase [Streptomyces sp. NPDC050560]|uniref:aromatase/cyclase n=1 Tax=Streptomyces sp. NPDC050560 TaxID=3365630 RepID=UPI00378CF7E7